VARFALVIDTDTDDESLTGRLFDELTSAVQHGEGFGVRTAGGTFTVEADRVEQVAAGDPGWSYRAGDDG
jgi:hypothetical protein